MTFKDLYTAYYEYQEDKEINYDEFEYHANQINKKYDKDKDKSDDFDLGL